MKPSSFFKLMIPSIYFKKLRIPEKFARAFKDDLSADCTLTVPTGETKKVAVVEDDNKLWFKDGWQEFVEYFSVGYGYFLLFSYQGSSAFRVHIFDLTACEISYQCKASSSSSPTAEEPRDSYQSTGSSDNEIMPSVSPDDGNLNPRSSDNEGMSSEEEPAADDSETDDSDSVSEASLLSQPAGLYNSDVETILIDSEDDEINTHKGSKCTRNKKRKNAGTQLSFSSWLLNYEEMIKDLAAAGVSIPENPFFVSLIRLSNLHKGNYMTIPSDFAQEHMNRCKQGDLITVETYDGRQWLVQCHRKNVNTYYLGKRWINFARDVGLEVGDVCVFELSDAENYVLKVQLAKKANLPHFHTLSLDSRNHDEIKPRQGRKRKATPLYKDDGVLQAVAAAGVCLPKSPFFVALITHACLKKACYLRIPLGFAREHLKCEKGDYITVETYHEKRWLIQCYRSQTLCTLSRGWMKFARGVGLEEGDACLFELRDAEQCVLKVQVAKKANLLEFLKPRQGRKRSRNEENSDAHLNPRSSDNKGMSSEEEFSSDDSETDDSDSIIEASSLSMSAGLCHSDVEVITVDSEDDEMQTQKGSKYTRNKKMKKKNEGTQPRHPSWSLNYEETIKALAATGVSIPENPFFVSLINPSNLHKGNYLNIPSDFARQHMIRCKKGELITIETHEVKEWLVQFDRRIDKGCSLIGKQWIVFARKIGLEVGDVCVFELSDAQNYVLKVQVAKKAILPDFCTSSLIGKRVSAYSSCSGKYDELPAGVFIPESPFFVPLIKHHNLHTGCHVNIPLDFAREHLKCKKGLVQCYRSYTNCKLSRGWMKFARGIGLEEGDACVFELSDAEQCVLKVQVVKKSQIKDANLSTGSSSSCTCPRAEEPRHGDLSTGSSDNEVVSSEEELDSDDTDTDDSEASSLPQSAGPYNSDVEVIPLDSEDDEMQTQKGSKNEGTQSRYPSWSLNYEETISDAENYVLKVQVAKKANLPNFCTSSLIGKGVSANSSCSGKDDELPAGVSLPKSPFFVALIKHQNLHKGCYMSIPLAFAREHLKCKEGDYITVETYDEKRWLVQCYRGHTTFRLSRGWMMFARGIGLEEGDSCVFELSDAEQCVFKVQVAKKVNLVEYLKPGQGRKRSRNEEEGKATPVWKDDGVLKAIAAAGVD